LKSAFLQSDDVTFPVTVTLKNTLPIAVRLGQADSSGKTVGRVITLTTYLNGVPVGSTTQSASGTIAPGGTLTVNCDVPVLAAIDRAAYGKKAKVVASLEPSPWTSTKQTSLTAKVVPLDYRFGVTSATRVVTKATGTSGGFTETVRAVVKNTGNTPFYTGADAFKYTYAEGGVPLSGVGAQYPGSNVKYLGKSAYLLPGQSGVFEINVGWHSTVGKPDPMVFVLGDTKQEVRLG
jgi:hypothetical protein